MAVRQLEDGRHEVENQYARAVTREGVPLPRSRSSRCSRSAGTWRGIGAIPVSGYHLRPSTPASTPSGVSTSATSTPKSTRPASPARS